MAISKKEMAQTLYPEVIEEIMEEGMEKGREEGLRKSILDVLFARFGKVPERLSEKLEAVHGEERLHELIRKAAVVKSLDEIMSQILS
jgi:hypothetical protein